jgi:hypothetical protein
VKFVWKARPARARKMFGAALAAALAVIIPAAAFGETGSEYHVLYDGGTAPDLKPGAKLRLIVVGDEIRFVQGQKEAVLRIPASAVTEISYGQDVHRRVGAAVGLAIVSLGVGALMALTKSKKHFVGITWDAQGAKGGVAIQCDKNEYRGVLLTLEGVTGKKAVDSSTLTVKN